MRSSHFLILRGWTRGTFSEEDFFFAMRPNHSDDACMWGRYSKKLRTIMICIEYWIFSLSSQEQIIIELPCRQKKKKKIRGSCFRLMTLGNYLFSDWKKINTIHYCILHIHTYYVVAEYLFCLHALVSRPYCLSSDSN